MDGFEATRLIRQSIYRDIPIIALTASAMPADQDRCLHAGMSDYIAKPVELGLLSDVLVKWLSVTGNPDKVARTVKRNDEQATAIFDSGALVRRLMGNRRVIDPLLKGFLEDAPSQLSSMRKQLDDENIPAARLQAHALCGAAATVSADSLGAVAMAIEQAAIGGQLVRCKELLPCALEEFQRFKGALETTGWI